ncbi:hypothetical protein SSX86_020901 [Deinandra increscens subsp. villosa]|uniref:Alpha-ketoglutarate-dependent dioxygenase AlkB-like domain-containing protein n=1 Tax=Deinandra increscens subsp. villosa TaxID=3103831 RepID=A0AAP0CTW4_9ASTR
MKKEAAFHGCLIGRFKQYSTEPKPFSILHPRLWPGTDGSWKSSKASYKILGSGLIHLRKYINIKGQADIVNTIVRHAQGPGAFYVPSDQDGEIRGLHMTTFGRNWDPITRYEKRCRSDDGFEPLQIPLNFIHLVETAIKDAQAYLKKDMRFKKKYAHACLDELPSMRPDICVANFYSPYGHFVLHQDCDESSDSLEKGLPVVSISVGDEALFYYGHTRDERKLSYVHIKSGDVLIYGDESRLIYHGVNNICMGSRSCEFVRACRMDVGHLNLILKQV